LIDWYNSTNLEGPSGSNFSKWLLRFELDSGKLTDRHLSMELIENILKSLMKEIDVDIDIIRNT